MSKRVRSYQTVALFPQERPVCVCGQAVPPSGPNRDLFQCDVCGFRVNAKDHQRGIIERVYNGSEPAFFAMHVMLYCAHTGQPLSEVPMPEWLRLYLERNMVLDTELDNVQDPRSTPEWLFPLIPRTHEQILLAEASGPPANPRVRLDDLFEESREPRTVEKKTKATRRPVRDEGTRAEGATTWHPAISTPEETARKYGEVLRNLDGVEWTRETGARRVPKAPEPRTGIPSSVGEGGRYTLLRQLGQGAFGCVMLARSKTTGRELAVKLERADAQYPQLLNETRALMLLNDRLPEGHVPTVIAYGRIDNYLYMVMDLLGDNVANLQSRCGGRFSLRTVILLALQLLDRVQMVHSAGIVHRDIKPDNFMLSLSGRRVLLVDFGLFKQYVNPETMEHIPDEENHQLMGTPRYASVSCHLGHQLSRRDDLESLGYVLVFLLAGGLPWAIEEATAPQDRQMEIYDQMATMKQQMGPAGLTSHYRIPEVFARLIDYAQNLRFNQEPDYGFLRGLFTAELRLRGWTIEDKLDWEMSESEREQWRATESAPSREAPRGARAGAGRR